jgi:four helix bundle protein
MQHEKRADFRDLILWQRAMVLAVLVYQITRRFPREELYGITTQLRRAAVSIPSNIAEGAARRTTRDFINFLHIARGSLAELNTQLILAVRLGLADSHIDWQSSIDEVARLLNAVIKGLQRMLSNPEQE